MLLDFAALRPRQRRCVLEKTLPAKKAQKIAIAISVVRLSKPPSEPPHHGGGRFAAL